MHLQVVENRLVKTCEFWGICGKNSFNITLVPEQLDGSIIVVAFVGVRAEVGEVNGGQPFSTGKRFSLPMNVLKLGSQVKVEQSMID